MNIVRKTKSIFGIASLVLFSSSLLFGQARPIEKSSPVYDLADLAVEYGVKEAGQNGIVVKISLYSDKVAGLNHFLRITLLDENEDPLEDTDGRFAVDGLVGTQTNIRTTKPSETRNLKFFVPYDDIEVIGTGEQLLLMDFDVVDADGELVQHIGLHEFLFTFGGMSSNESDLGNLGINGVLTNVNVSHNVVRQSSRGMVVKFTVDQVTGLKGINATIAVRFLKSVDDEEYVQSALSKYADANGDLIFTFPIKASFDPAKFSDVEIFVPYAAFPFKKGNHKVEMDFDILVNLSEEAFAHLGYKSAEIKIK